MPFAPNIYQIYKKIYDNKRDEMELIAERWDEIIEKERERESLNIKTYFLILLILIKYLVVS